MSETVAQGNNSFFSYDDTNTHGRMYDYDSNQNKGRFTFDLKPKDKANLLEKAPGALGINRATGRDIHAARAGNFGQAPAEQTVKKVEVLPVVVPGEPQKLGAPEDHRDAISEARWQHFTDSTTFHGIRYIFEDTPFKLRRYSYSCNPLEHTIKIRFTYQ